MYPFLGAKIPRNESRKWRGKERKVYLFSLFESTHNPISCLIFLFSPSHKKQLAASFYFHFSAFSSFFISLNEASTLRFSFKCSPSSFQLKCLPSPFAFSIKIDLVDLALLTHPFCGSKELLLMRNVAPFTVEKE